MLDAEHVKYFIRVFGYGFFFILGAFAGIVRPEYIPEYRMILFCISGIIIGLALTLGESTDV